MTSGKEWKLILLFTLPIMAGNLLQQLYNTADNIIVGNYVSQSAFAAVATCAPLTLLFLAFALGLSIGANVVVAQLFGAREEDRLAVSVDTAMLLLGAVGAIVTALGIIFTPFLLQRVMTVPEELMAQSVTYLRIYCIGLLFQFVYNAIAAILRGIGDSKASLYFLLITAALNIGLDLFAVLLLHMGVAGTAWATVVSQLVCVAVSYVYLRRRFRFVRSGRHFDAGICKTILKIGLPTALQQSIVSLGNVAMQRLVNDFGETVIAAYGAGSRINMFAFVPIIGFQSGLASFTGQNIGAGRLDRVRRGYLHTLIMGLAATVLLCAALFFAARPIVALFGLSGESLAIGVTQIKFYAKIFWFFSLYMILGGVLQGAGDTILQSVATLSALAIRVALGYLGVYVFHWFGYTAAWETNLYGWIVAIIITNIRYFTGGWKKKAVVSRAPAKSPEG
jgi:putative MATE family efflux protein